jgi:hypothetical protein
MRRIARCLIPGVLFAITLSAQEPPAPPPPPPPPPPPQIFAPGNLLLSTDSGHCYASGLILGTPVAKDFAGGHTIEVTRDDGRLISEPFQGGTTIVTWTVMDASGQTATTKQIIIVKDNEPPKIEAPPDVEVTADDGCFKTKVSEGQPTITDNCSAAEFAIIARRSDGPEYLLSDEHPPFQIGTTRVTWTVTDKQGRQRSASQKIVVKDGNRPRIAAPPDVFAKTDPGKCTAFVNVGTATVSDTCSRHSLEVVRSDGKRRLDMPFPAGRTTIVWTATNDSGRSASVEQEVVVKDSEGPVIGDLTTNVKELWPPNQRLVGVKVSYNAADLCGGEVKTFLGVESSEPDDDNNSPDSFVIGDHFVDLRAESAVSAERVYTIFVRAVDVAGNESTKTTTVTVRPPAESRASRPQ